MGLTGYWGGGDISLGSSRGSEAELACIDVGRKAQRAEGFLRVVGVGADVDKHQSLAVAAQAGGQEMGELGVSVGNVGLVVGNRGEDVAQAREGLVDSAGLLRGGGGW